MVIVTVEHGLHVRIDWNAYLLLNTNLSNITNISWRVGLALLIELQFYFEHEFHEYHEYLGWFGFGSN